MSEVQPTDSKKYYCLVTLTVPSGYRLATHQPPSKTNLGTWLRISGTRMDDAERAEHVSQSSAFVLGRIGKHSILCLRYLA
ncbi:hypothetical protein CHS0354_040393 [Potamilus streckersoni]|uniref:Uncharacterized protein n=1 Tax=Potamilus streckersoni TaxID=2493646 RepID=A0AAE0S172_9BIVA|nr:hypothetical protein CHS0354_040393 [Potamilus streckersoni]